MDTVSEILNSASNEINDNMCSKSSSCLISNAIKEEAYVQLGDHKLRFEHTEFDAEDKEKARKELRETPEIVAEALEEFRRLLKNEPLNYPTDEDDRLKIFLRPCKYYPESALHRMKTFYKYKVKHPKYYENLIPSKETRAFHQSLINALPQRGENGERILIVEAGRKWNTKTCTLNEILRSVMLILEAALAEPRTQISGVHVILDMAGLSLNHVWQFTPVFAKNVVDWVQDCIPIRLKGIHIVNQPYIFNMVFALFKPFLGEKLQNRIHFHGSNFDALHNFITPKILPAQFGGNANMPMDKGEELHKYLMLYEEDLTLKGQEGYASVKDCD